jgi:methylated-DNA-protein-cysteine methyltransferase-like protein
MSPFKDRVIQIIRMIPQGRVASYGQVAAYAGLPRAAREVGWTLRDSKEDMPWWRVLNNAGKISIDGNMSADKTLQRKLLEGDGIEVADDFTLDMEKYRWRLDTQTIKQLRLDDEYIEKLVTKYGV